MLTVIDPTTGEVVREVEHATPEDAQRALATAAEAYATWSRRSFDERAGVLREVAKRLRGDRERFAMLMTEEMGKPITEARGEVEKAAW
jgi:succinate-semialdehyde dehydrogenase / glutarate-semialdehyde dehydrogenase